MERNIMGELNVYRGSGARPNIREIARRHDMDRHTVAKYWRNGRLGAAAGRGQKDNRIGPRDRVGNVGVSAPTADRQTQAAPVLESGIAT